MAVKKYEVFPLEYQEPNDNMATRYITLVRLETDDGIVGWGECISQFRPNTLAVTAMLEGGLADLVIGRDPLENKQIWRDLKDEVWWYGDAGGTASFAISALDMAIWDLKGKILGQPLYALLGGKAQERLPVCASTHPKEHSIDAMAEELAGHIKNGYQIVKVGFGKKGAARLGMEAARDISFVKAVRQAIGPEAGFIVDIGAKMHWSIPYAVKMARAFAEYNLTWLEDPFHPDNFEGYQALRAAVPHLMIGFGERSWNLHDYKRLLDARTCDVILIDPGRTDGITGMQRITQLAAQYNVKMDPHCWSSAIITAASLHIAMAAPNASIFEMKPLKNPMQHELVAQPFAPVEGYMHAPDGPGLGVEVNEDVVRHYHMRG